MKGKRKAGEKKRKKGKAGGKGGTKREKINKGKNYDKICYIRGENRYIFTQSVRYLLGRKNGGNI